MKICLMAAMLVPLAAFSQMTAVRPDLRVLFSTGYTAEAASLNSLTEQGASVLQKPYSLKNLGQMVRAILDRPPDHVCPHQTQRNSWIIFEGFSPAGFLKDRNKSTRAVRQRNCPATPSVLLFCTQKCGFLIGGIRPKCPSL